VSLIAVTSMLQCIQKRPHKRKGKISFRKSLPYMMLLHVAEEILPEKPINPSVGDHAKIKDRPPEGAGVFGVGHLYDSTCNQFVYPVIKPCGKLLKLSVVSLAATRKGT
jgi:hypothetical protein